MKDFRYSPGKPGRKDDVGLQLDEGSFNRILEGEPALVEVPKNEGFDFVFDEDTPFVATGPFELVVYKNGVPNAYETGQLATRLQYVHFTKSIAKEAQNDTRNPCGRCYAKWLLHGEATYREKNSKHPLSTTPIFEVARETLFPGRFGLQSFAAAMVRDSRKSRVDSGDSASSSSMDTTRTSVAAQQKTAFERMKELVAWKEQGLVDEEEFKVLKRKMLAE
jgi:hypothetical protein